MSTETTTEGREALEKRIEELQYTLDNPCDCDSCVRNRPDWKESLLLATELRRVMDAAEIARQEMLQTYEKGAEAHAIACDMGVSEWEAFMPKEYHTINNALRVSTSNLAGGLR